MNAGLGSLRGRIIVLSVLLVFVLLLSAMRLQQIAGEALVQNKANGEQFSVLARTLGDLEAALYDAEGGLYQYAVLTHEDQRVTALAAKARIRSLSEQLSGLVSEQSDAELKELAAELTEAISRAESKSAILLQLLSRIDTRFPVAPLVSNDLHRQHMQFVAAAEAAQAEVDELEPMSRDSARKIVERVRYAWIQHIAAMRMYLATRSGVFGPDERNIKTQLSNRLTFLGQVDESLRELAAMERRGRLNFAMAESLEQMFDARRRFDEIFQQVSALYESQRWRSDVPFFREHLKPAFLSVWSVVGRMDKRVSELSASNMEEANVHTGTVARFVWMVTGLASIFVLVTWISFELLIRRPMGQVTRALRALERGTAYSPLVKTYAAETDEMMAAFRDMQRQVYARETRLALILDNAGEGIITINEKGIIETFNNAAEQLFGWREEEALGRNVTILMPHPTRDEHDGFLRRYQQTKEPRVLGSEVNVTAQRKDGTLFPMSIKVTELVLEGRRYFTAIVSDISEQKAMLDNLRQLAEHDFLTGLYNRQYFLEELERVVERAKRQGGLDCALFYIDLDNFKFVNDTLGHQAGDRVLVEVSRLIERRSRRGDLIARLGGDEFAVLVFDVDEKAAHAVAEEYRHLMTEYSFRHEGRIIDVGCSIGIACLEPDVVTKEDLMARADISCHMAKRSGRNCVHLFRPDDRRSVDDMNADMGWARTLKMAIEEDRFDFALQPIVDVHTGDVVSREVLLRMRDLDGSILMPSGFMPSAERFGLVVEIDRWVVEHAVALLARREDKTEYFSINISGKSVGDPNFLVHVTTVLRRHRVDPARLTFEITETVAIADLNAAIELLEGLRALGCRTSLDDFGAGYSSFAYLKDLPVDYVKIDGSFVRNIDQDALHLAMVRSMNEIAHAMGKKTVAEFVGSAPVLEKLAEIGVDWVQGYHVGMPELAGYTAVPKMHGVA